MDFTRNLGDLRDVRSIDAILKTQAIETTYQAVRTLKDVTDDHALAQAVYLIVTAFDEDMKV